jgi:GNAT superfamily N-acetyltransferase
MDITYRPAREDDLGQGIDIVVDAINDLRSRHGFPLSMRAGPPLFQRLCLAEGAEGLWVAETQGKVVGFAMSWMSQRFWFLAQLFVRPELQAKGVGQALLSRTLEQAQSHGASNRALVTFAYNPRSTGLYIQNGMYPREPLYFMSAPASGPKMSLGRETCEVVPVGPLDQSKDWIGYIDEEVLGFRRDIHHGFLLNGVAARAVQITHHGNLAGYAYISEGGHIGPLAIVPGADENAVVGAAIRCALEDHPQQISMIVPGAADAVMTTASDLGFRILEPYVLLSEKPFGNWQCYLPSNPGYL